jgi:hypothetical protein
MDKMVAARFCTKTKKIKTLLSVVTQAVGKVTHALNELVVLLLPTTQIPCFFVLFISTQFMNR